MTKLTRRTFTTQDTKGCFFTVKSYHTIENNGDRASVYYADGLNVEAKTLKELKKLVSKIK